MKIFKRLVIVSVILFMLSCFSYAIDQEQIKEDSLENFIDDFKEDSLTGGYQDIIEKNFKDAFKKEPFFRINGSFKFASSYNFAHSAPIQDQTDWRGVSSLQSEALLEMRNKPLNTWQAYIRLDGYYDMLYSAGGRGDYSEQVLDKYEKNFEIQGYVQGTAAKNLDVKIGRQIEVWGKSDTIRVTDVLNPLDIREPGLTDLEDLRIPLFMTKLGYYIGDWNIKVIGVHEHSYNKRPEYGSDFYTSSQAPVYEDIPCYDLENTEFALSLNSHLNQKDISFYFANFFDDSPSLDINSSNSIEMQHVRLKMVGTAFNYALGNWLLKTETALFDGVEASVVQMLQSGSLLKSYDDYLRLDIMGGVEYSGFTDTTISIEAVNRHLYDFDDIAQLAGMQKNSSQTAFRVSKDFFNQTLNLSVLGSMYNPADEGGGFYRLSGQYDYTDNITLYGCIIFYESGETGAFKNLGENDRIYFSVKYSF